MRQSDNDENPCRWSKCNIDPFLISNVETRSSVLRFKKCFSTFLKFTTNKEIKILLLNNQPLPQKKNKQKAKLINHLLNFWVISRISPPEVLLRKDVLKICSKFTWEHTRRSVISIKLLCNFIDAALRHECSPVNLMHIFRTPSLRNTFKGLLLN